MIGKIFLGVVSFLVFPAGFVIGLWYFFKKKERLSGAIFAGLGLLALILIALSGGDSSQTVTTQSIADTNSTSTTVTTQSIADTKPTSTPAPTNVDLREILNLRDANEVAADTKYIGMYVSIEGEISQIHEKSFHIIPLRSGDFQMAGAECNFDKSQSPDLIELRKGETITIVGVIKDISDFMYNELDIKPCKF